MANTAYNFSKVHYSELLRDRKEIRWTEPSIN